MRKSFVGAQLRRLREERNLSQASVADALGLPVDHLSQLELNQRPLTIPLLLNLNGLFGVDVRLADDGRTANDEQLADELARALSRVGPAEAVDTAEVRYLVANMPALARALAALCREQAGGRERAGISPAPPPRPPPVPHEEVREHFRARHCHVDELDTAAETLHRTAGLSSGDLRGGLAAYLARRHAIDVRIENALDEDAPLPRPEDDDLSGRVLRLPGHLPPGRHAFQLATRIAFLEQPGRLDRLVAGAAFSGEESRRLARIALAKYFASALLLPYGPFREAAETLRYDIERLARRFGAGMEMVCQRLGTLQRPGAEGVPFLFVRLDQAGNVSKWQAAADLGLRPGDAGCPLWTVHEAFAHPGRILAQHARMPDGRTHFWIARAITRRHGGFGAPATRFSIGLGCAPEHARRLVYAAGLDATGATPVGPGCGRCERPDCPQRAYPPTPAAASR